MNGRARPADITQMQTDSHLDPTFRRHRVVAIVKGLLDVEGTASACERAGKLDEETVTYGFNLPPAMLGKYVPQQVSLLVEKIERERLVLLRQRAVAHHVSEHDAGQPSMLMQFFSHQVFRAPQQIFAL